jgi:hypothetical protein
MIGGCHEENLSPSQDKPSSRVSPSAVVHDIAGELLLSLAHDDDSAIKPVREVNGEQKRRYGEQKRRYGHHLVFDLTLLSFV